MPWTTEYSGSPLVEPLQWSNALSCAVAMVRSTLSAPASGAVASAEMYPTNASPRSAPRAKAASTAAPYAPSRTPALSITCLLAVASPLPPQQHERPAPTRRATSSSAVSTAAANGANHLWAGRRANPARNGRSVASSFYAKVLSQK